MLATNIIPKKVLSVVEVVSVTIAGGAIQQIRMMGDPKQFTATVSPSNATNQTLTWTSANTNLFTVDQTGLVKPTGFGTGSAQLKATSNNGKQGIVQLSVTA